MEHKLVLVAELLPRMPYDTVLMILEAFEALLVSVEERHNFLTRNTNFLMVVFQLYVLSQNMALRFNRLNARLKKFQEDLMELVKSLTGALGNSPTFVQAVLKAKDYKG